MPIYTVLKIGSCAWDRLRQAQSARLVGQSSRGWFLHLSNGWIIFLSCEEFAGPLTLNLGVSHQHLPAMPDQATAVIPAGTIDFPEVGLSVLFKSARIWEPPQKPASTRMADEMMLSVERMTDQLTWSRPPSPLANQVLSLLRLLPPDSASEVDPRLASLPGAVIEGNMDQIRDIFASLLGTGQGLTPSGDDVLLGFLLALGRWGEVVSPGLEVFKLKQELIPLAYHKTTTLSANLLECAADGQADERLIYALDGCIVGMPDIQACVQSLLAWGNSSGMDAFCGMAIAIRLGSS